MMGCLIPHILLLIFHHCHILHLQILHKRGIYVERYIKMRLSANTSANNGINQFGNMAAVGKLTVCN